MEIMKRILWVLIVASAMGAGGAALRAAGSATAAFQKLQSLAGDWEGKDEGGDVVKTNFKMVASNTAVLETLAMPGMEEMLTVYSVDGNTIALAHFCPTGNQPRMRATPTGDAVKELNFSFEGAGNLATPETGHQHKLVIQFQDQNHVTEHWTWRKNGKDTEMIFHFTRRS
jgi:hypothetical protein